MTSLPTSDSSAGPVTWAIDIGGSHLKSLLLDPSGGTIGRPVRVETPDRPTPGAVLAGLRGLALELGSFDRISVGFPGVLRHGRVLTAPNLDNESWRNFSLAAALWERFDRPARVMNDATVQGFGVIGFRGIECVITLGTGMGFALFQDGRPSVHLELAHHPLRKRKTYEDYVGRDALDDVGTKKWNRRVRRVIDSIERLVCYDMLYIGGGNASHLVPDFPANVRIVDNEAGMWGGIHLWDPAMDPYFAVI
ncbi:MAG: ROK family protein [Acetobacteraceae bacterium]